MTIMSEDSALELLSPELQQHILLKLENLEALYAIIRASPRFYQVFRLNEEHTLSTIALRQFHPAVQPEALAVARLAQIQHNSQRDTQVLRESAMKFCDHFPADVQRWYAQSASGPVTKHICRLEKAVNFFIDDYARNTQPILAQLGQSQDPEILSEYPPYSYVLQPRLSSTEILRLQRAFCRFELYRRLFSRCSLDSPDGVHKCIRLPPLRAPEQAKHFLQDLPVFQISEMSCVRDYLFRRLRGIFDRLENEAVRTLPLEAMTFEEFGERANWRSPFYVFTAEAQHQQEEHLEHLISLGLPYIRRVIESSGDEQRDLFLHYVHGPAIFHFEGDFLSKALDSLDHNPHAPLDHSPSLQRRNDCHPACNNNGHSETPQGWSWGHQHHQPLNPCSHIYKGLRDWGYVFWDYDRLQESGILGRDPQEVRKVRFADDPGYGRLSVEQRLHAAHPSCSNSKSKSQHKEQERMCDIWSGDFSLDSILP